MSYQLSTSKHFKSDDFLPFGAGKTVIICSRILSMPSSIQSITAAADPEDFVSMGMNTALKNFQILDNAYGVLGIELMAAAQGLDFRKHKLGDGVKLAKDLIREKVDFLDIDRPLHGDHNTMKKMVKTSKIVDEIELSFGNLYEEKVWVLRKA